MSNAATKHNGQIFDLSIQTWTRKKCSENTLKSNELFINSQQQEQK